MLKNKTLFQKAINNTAIVLSLMFVLGGLAIFGLYKYTVITDERNKAELARMQVETKKLQEEARVAYEATHPNDTVASPYVSSDSGVIDNSSGLASSRRHWYSGYSDSEFSSHSSHHRR